MAKKREEEAIERKRKEKERKAAEKAEREFQDNLGDVKKTKKQHDYVKAALQDEVATTNVELTANNPAVNPTTQTPIHFVAPTPMMMGQQQMMMQPMAQ